MALELTRALRAEIDGEVRFTPGDRALYAYDASVYRQVPIGVVIPRDANDVEAALAVCRRFQTPVFGRGCGTGLAGQTVNAAVVFRLLQVHEPDHHDGSRPAEGPGAARRDLRPPARRGRGARPHIRSGPRNARPRDAGWDDRQQLMRHAFGDGRQDSRQHR